MKPANFTVFGNNEAYVMITLKYWFLKQLAHTFDVGCKFRYCESDKKLPDYDMIYTFGQKPAITASVALNPDETWTIALANLTGCHSDDLPITDTHTESLFQYYPAETYTITATVDEMAGTGAQKMALCRSNKTTRFEFEDSVTVTDGVIDVTVGPKELVTLRGAKGAMATTAYQAGSGATLPAVGWPHVAKDGRVVVAVNRAGLYTIELLDMTGRTTIAKETFVCGARSQFALSTQGFGQGVYLLRVWGSECGTKVGTVLVR